MRNPDARNHRRLHRGLHLSCIVLALLGMACASSTYTDKDLLNAYAKALPPQGFDTLHPHTSIELNLFGRGVERIDFSPENVVLRVKRGAPARNQFGVNTVETEIVELSLTGESKLIGSFKLIGGYDLLNDEARRIRGAIVLQQAKGVFPANNYFDVFLEVHTAQGVFFNKRPEHMSAVIDSVPPNFARTPYEATTEINLYSKENPDGPPVGAIVAVQHNAAAQPRQR